MTQGFKIIAATATNGGIGLNGTLPWHNITDMKYFRNMTTQRIDEFKTNAIIMGRKTWESLNSNPLPGRLNVCITSQPLEGVVCFSDLNNALKYLYENERVESIFVIGGGVLYEEAIRHSDCTDILINRIDCDAVCDTFFPEIDLAQYFLSSSHRLSDDVVNEHYLHQRFARLPIPVAK
jgi:dihydrofolate reductase